MNAEQARKLSARNLQTVVVGPLVDHIHRMIEKAATEGKSRIVHPLHGFSPWPEVDVQLAVWAALRNEGYTVTNHPDPDPGDPRSSSYDEVSW